MPDSIPATSAGARWEGGQTQFQLRSIGAEAVELCLFDSPDCTQEAARVALESLGEGRWEIHLADIQPGQLYGYRVDGPWQPHRGARFNSAKLLLDPRAAAICGEVTWHPALSDFDHQAGQDHPSRVDTAALVPRSVVVDPRFDWQEDAPPAIPWEETVIYECHVRGMTRLHPGVPEHLRGTYLGLIEPPVLEHLTRLGVTTLELLPVQHFISEERLHRLGLSNYFGYNPIGWMAPHAAYATGDRGEQVVEFKTMVAGLHAAGIEILLDVVFNHTAEGNQHGPSLSWRGIDNADLYRLVADDPRHYENFSGCGNTVHFGRSAAVDLTLECLRYWVTEMHVDGFRFDLASIHGREEGLFDPAAAFFERLASDPVLRSVKLIAEPWDVGPHGYRLGQFPADWHEWNDRFRDTVRGYWRGDQRLTGELIERLEGSPDLFPRDRRGSNASINLVTSHDGFTLQDLVSYERTHNWDNGEHNRDGHQHNLSRNWGTEGPTDSPEIQGMRRLMVRNFLATLALARGVPMLSHGDELGRTQLGNNNAYCQDSEITWMPWPVDDDRWGLQDFVRQAFSLRRDLALGSSDEASWISAHGGLLTPVDLDRHLPLPIGWLRHHRDCYSLTVINGDDRRHLFELPRIDRPRSWRLALNSAGEGEHRLERQAVRVPARSVLFLISQD